MEDERLGRSGLGPTTGRGRDHEQKNHGSNQARGSTGLDLGQATHMI